MAQKCPKSGGLKWLYFVLGAPAVEFLAVLSSMQNGFDGTIVEILIVDNEYYDYGNNYDHTTGIFLTPITGTL